MKLTTLLAIVLMASCVVYAGPHFTVEQNPLEPEAFVEVGWDFEANRIDFTNFSIDGDFFVINDNLWLYPTPWIGGFELGFYWEDEDRTRDLAEVNFDMSVERSHLFRGRITSNLMCGVRPWESSDDLAKL